MPLQKLSVTGLDNENQRRRMPETINQILTHQFDDSRAKTKSEVLANVTVVNPAYPPYELGPRYGILADGTTDQSSQIIATTTAIGAGVYTIPYNVKFNRATVCAGIPTTVLILDLSMVNSYADPGFRIKRVGILSSDVSADDTGWYIESGHHPGITLNNFGTSGTASAAKRVVSLDIASNVYTSNTDDKGGDRFFSNLTWQKNGTGNFWSFSLNCGAPWLSVAASFERWTTGEVISGTTYRYYQSNHYISTSVGTTGATPPTHSSGTVSDGGVNWTWLDFVGRTLFDVDEYARVKIGTNSVGATFTQQANILDPTGGAYLMDLYAANNSKNADLKLNPTNSGGTASAQPFLRAQDSVGLRFMRSSGAGDLARINDTQGLYIGIESHQSTSVTTGTTIDVGSSVSARTQYLTYSGATNITALTNGVDDQEVTFIATNGNATFVSSATLLLQGSVNVTLTAWSSISFHKVPSAISNRWIEVSRSIK